MKQKAKTIAWISVILPILTLGAGIYMATELESFWIALAAIASAWISYVFLSSYADLLESADETNEMVRALLENQAQSERRTYAASAPSQEPASTEKAPKISMSEPAPFQKVEATTATTDPTNANFITCDNCGTRQRSNRTRCFNCGANFTTK